MNEFEVVSKEEISQLRDKVQSLEEIVLNLSELIKHNTSYGRVWLSYEEAMLQLGYNDKKSIQRAIKRGFLVRNGNGRRVSLDSVIQYKMQITKQPMEINTNSKLVNSLNN